jgi:hypothetical protein
MATRNPLTPVCRLLATIGLTCVAVFAQALSYANFTATTDLLLKGTAITTQTSDGTVLRLTKAECCSAGSAFTATAIPFQIAADTFSTFFQFRITSPGGIAPADGIAFVIRENGTAALGSTANSVGYDGIGNSLGIKFDTYQNEKEINDNFVAIQTNGVLRDEFTQTPFGVANCTKPVGIVGCMANGDLWSVWIDYDGVNLHVAVAYASTTRPPDLINVPLSLPRILHYTSAAFAGFTAGTGGGFENHDIVNWVYYSTYNPTEPGTKQILPST